METTTEPLLWSIVETARQLGGLSTRTVRRMIDRGDIPAVKVGRTVRVPAHSVRSWIESQLQSRHNNQCAGDVRQEKSTCHTNVKIVRFGGHPTPTRAARELDALLERRTERKPTP
ncbi:helix-turn-helix domain-containing protein [Methyloterricola oryzae]|uniref:helix-turn-helix domain-containing protein n=1 Tax=Methyloterricola oryzae TaxID=1495050 RepID=UPI0009E3DDF2